MLDSTETSLEWELNQLWECILWKRTTCEGWIFCTLYYMRDQNLWKENWAECRAIHLKLDYMLDWTGNYLEWQLSFGTGLHAPAEFSAMETGRMWEYSLWDWTTFGTVFTGTRLHARLYVWYEFWTKCDPVHWTRLHTGLFARPQSLDGKLDRMYGNSSGSGLHLRLLFRELTDIPDRLLWNWTGCGTVSTYGIAFFERGTGPDVRISGTGLHEGLLLAMGLVLIVFGRMIFCVPIFSALA